MVSFVAGAAGAFLGKWVLSTPSLYDALPAVVSAASGSTMLRFTYTLDRSVPGGGAFPLGILAVGFFLLLLVVDPEREHVVVDVDVNLLLLHAGQVCMHLHPLLRLHTQLDVMSCSG
jgi:hypothetical protein